MKETLAERNARYFAEGRTVSGGDGNGPGKPGYKVIDLEIDNESAANQLNLWADQGYEVKGFDKGRVILANYKKDS